MATTAATLRRTNEVPGTRAKLSNHRASASKVRAVLDLIRGVEVTRAEEILRFCERAPAVPIAKLLRSAIANAAQNDGLDRDELFVSACFADEGPTMKRWRPGSKGRAGRIRKRTSHITIVVSRLSEDRLAVLRASQETQEGSRQRRVAGSRAARVAGARKKDAVKADDSATNEDPSKVEETASNDAASSEAPEAAAETKNDNDGEGK